MKHYLISYLKSDVEGLLEAVTKFKDNFYNKYQLNITKYKTLPGLVLAVYCSSYISNSLKSEIKVIKGELEREIRTSYFGGNVDVFINKINKGFYYDINSQYPAAMLNDMPVGEPILSLEKNITFRIIRYRVRSFLPKLNPKLYKKLFTLSYKNFTFIETFSTMSNNLSFIE